MITVKCNCNCDDEKLVEFRRKSLKTVILIIGRVFVPVELCRGVIVNKLCLKICRPAIVKEEPNVHNLLYRNCYTRFHSR